MHASGVSSRAPGLTQHRRRGNLIPHWTLGVWTPATTPSGPSGKQIRGRGFDPNVGRHPTRRFAHTWEIQAPHPIEMAS